MATNKKQEEIAPEQDIQNALGKTEQFIENNSKTLITALVVVIVLVGGFFGYKHLIASPRTEKALAAMYVAEQTFNDGDYQKALDGDGVNAGFLEIIDQFGSTPQGNLAKHYAGICYFKAGNWEQAISYLKKYKATKGSPNVIVNAQNSGLIGDALVQSGDVAGSIAYYEKAVSTGSNILVTPYYLKKLGLAYEQLGKKDEAKKAYERIFYEFPSSLEANDALKFIGALEAAE